MNPKSFDASSLFGKKKSAPVQTIAEAVVSESVDVLESESAVDLDVTEANASDAVVEVATESVTEEVVESADLAADANSESATEAVIDEAPMSSPAFVAESKESFLEDQPQHNERPAVLDNGVVAEPSVASANITGSRTDVRDVSCSDLYGASGTKILKSLESGNILYRVFGDKRCTSMRAVVVSPATFKVILEQLALKNVRIDIAEKTIPWFTDVAFSSLSNGKLFRDGTLVHAIARRDLRPAGVASVLIQKSAPAVAYLLPANLYALSCE